MAESKPERKRQFNCQPDDETWDRMPSLKDRVAAALNLVKVSDAVLLRFAMIALEKEYPADSQKKGGKK